MKQRLTVVHDFSLPHSPEAERDVLGAILQNCAGTNEALQRLTPSHFSVPEHATIYRRLKTLVVDGNRPDVVTLVDSLEAHQEIDKVGGIEYVSKLGDGMPQLCQIMSWVSIVETKARLRERARFFQQGLEMVVGANGNGDEILKQTHEMISAHLMDEVAQKRIVTFLSGEDLAKATTESVHWIVNGFVATGGITELGAKVKMGKTTLAMALVRAVLDGLTFLGGPTSKTPVVYLTEQPPVSFREAMVRADLLGRSEFFVLSHVAVRGMPWAQVAAHAMAKCKSAGAGLLIVDTLPQFAGLVGDSENNSGDALAAMQPLQQAAAEGIGVILIRHERKAGGEVGDSGRGSSAFAGAVDIVLSLRRPEGNSRKTMRLLRALSRFSETPEELLIDLTDEGFLSLGEPHDAVMKEAKNSILAALPEMEIDAIPLKEITGITGISRVTAQRAIDELVRDGELSIVGAGKKGDPFRYFLSKK